MAKERVIRQLTDEQRKKIMETPGVIVHRREGPPPARLPEPKLQVNAPIEASDLINDDENDLNFEPAE